MMYKIIQQFDIIIDANHKCVYVRKKFMKMSFNCNIYMLIEQLFFI